MVSVSKQYQNQGLSLPDLINEGNLGLIKAAQRFDETRGFKFISYAVWWIRQSILQALAEQSRIVRLPLNKIGSINKINKAFARLEQEFERPPTAAELAETLDMTLDEVKQSMKNAGRHVSMDAPLKDGDESSSNMYDVLQTGDTPSPDTDLMTESLRKEIERSLRTLTPREADVVRFVLRSEWGTSHDSRRNWRALRPHSGACSSNQREGDPPIEAHQPKPDSERLPRLI